MNLQRTLKALGGIGGVVKMHNVHYFDATESSGHGLGWIKKQSK